MLCAPPDSITSASPRRMISVASPIAWLDAAQAVRQFRFGPWALNSDARMPAGTFGSCSISTWGSSIRSPPWENSAGSTSEPLRALHISCMKRPKSCCPSPAPRYTPNRGGSTRSPLMPASRTASVAAAMAKVTLRPHDWNRRASPTQSESRKFRTSAAIFVGNREASKCVIRPMPLPEWRSTFHIASTLLPTGVTTPMPVTTTRRLMLVVQ